VLQILLAEDNEGDVMLVEQVEWPSVASSRAPNLASKSRTRTHRGGLVDVASMWPDTASG